ncbi:DBF4 [[Candida] subhashii]|uniref:DBF4 n=1 Tax=[Candida] subhashii TaxID=561895 RepID=A0A8J5QQS7_9ASCO|nr:DBF4 [[Candida] subhashii]KAG7664905.1 DBF4 [[Candida] subhashii]
MATTTTPSVAQPGSALKKNFNSLLTKPRPPLRPANINIPSPLHKRAKLNSGDPSPRKLTTTNQSPLGKKSTTVANLKSPSKVATTTTTIETTTAITKAEKVETQSASTIAPSANDEISTTSTFSPVNYELQEVSEEQSEQANQEIIDLTKLEEDSTEQISHENKELQNSTKINTVPTLQPTTEKHLHNQLNKLPNRFNHKETETTVSVKTQIHIDRDISISTKKVERQTQPKKQKDVVVQHQQLHNHHNNQHQEQSQQQPQSRAVGRLVGEEFLKWQQTWRKIISESAVYFEGIQECNRKQMSDYRRASTLLKSVGCEIAPFYDNNVTIIVSRRPYDSNKTYPSNDIFSNVANFKIKVWNYDKVFRFLENLGINISTGIDEYAINTQNILPASLTTDSTNNKKSKDNLHNLLKDEKIFGSTDRDPNAKRDDLHYFGKNYLYVYDLSQKVRPIAIREWNDDSYTTLNMTLDGRCPFVSDPSDVNSERQRLRRKRKFEASQEYRSLLKKATYNIMNNIKNGGVSMTVSGFSGTSTSTDKAHEEDHNATVIQNSSSSKKLETKEDEEEQDDSTGGEIIPEVITSQSRFIQPHIPRLIRNSSCFQSNTKPFDIFAASGYNGASNAVPFSLDSNLNSNAAGGNGLGPMVSQVPSINLNNLKRRIIMKKRKTSPSEKQQKDNQRELNPGYCENCRVKYDCFDDHILSNRHRNFACDDDNFKDIDELIATLNESKSLGYVTYNGD